MAAAAASAAPVVPVAPEAQLPVPAEPVLAHLVVEARDLVVLVAAAFKPRLAHLVVVVLPLVLAELSLEARLPALARLVVVAGQLLQFLRSPSFSPTTARISPPPIQPTYERAPSTR